MGDSRVPSYHMRGRSTVKRSIESKQRVKGRLQAKEGLDRGKIQKVIVSGIATPLPSQYRRPWIDGCA